MPETVEVSIIVDHIREKFKNATLKNISINSGRYKKHGPPIGYSKFIKILPSKIISFNNKGKFIYLILENNISIWITLGLTGDLLLKPAKHSHVTFETNKGDFYFNDIRNFGTIKFSFNKAELDKKLNTLGPDPLTEDLTKSQFIKIMRKPSLQKKQIGTVLMNQKVVSGIGNYLRAEILYDAKISPFSTIENLSDEELITLLKSINKIILQSYKKQYQKGLHTYNFAVYQQKETKKGEKVECKNMDGRTIWYVNNNVKESRIKNDR